ncbi:hypothetical protein X781_15590 [Mannheimia sp. USDA-ARS-USMARC-1261]|nr:hypothetical protein X781_15590 [Mannheimia sp. USDA-ARS-USMARC-1261]
MQAVVFHSFFASLEIVRFQGFIIFNHNRNCKIFLKFHRLY